MSFESPELRLSGAFERFRARAGIARDASARGLIALSDAAPAMNLECDEIHLAAEIAALESGLDADTRLATIALIAAAFSAANSGSTRLPVVGIAGRAELARIFSPLVEKGAIDPKSLAESIERILEHHDAPRVIAYDDAEYRPLVFRDSFVYLQRSFAAERALAARLAAMLNSHIELDTSAISRAVDKSIVRPIASAGGAITVSAEQAAAVKLAVQSKLALISGGPGTGKTVIVACIVRALVHAGIEPHRIAVAAPTGKAADRLKQCLGTAFSESQDEVDRKIAAAPPEPATIHRLLGASADGARFRHHRTNPLAADAVIVDEASMLDLLMMERLAGAIAPDARLVILGDADQLPSVAAGAVFRDLVESTAGAALTSARIRLTRNYRSPGGPVHRLSQHINRGDVSIAGGGEILSVRGNVEEIEFDGAETIDAVGAELGALCERWRSRRVAGDREIEEIVARAHDYSGGGFSAASAGAVARAFEHRAASRILCVTRVLDTGSDRINSWFHSRAVRSGARAAPFVPGEPVIAVRNDYERRLFNGDNGIVLSVKFESSGAEPAAIFQREGSYVAHPLAAIGAAIELCYAMTVHKAQGSEFDGVMVVLPRDEMPILTREVLYTAVSRARRSAVVAGAQSVIRRAIDTPTRRYSGLGDEIARRLSTPS